MNKSLATMVLLTLTLLQLDSTMNSRNSLTSEVLLGHLVYFPESQKELSLSKFLHIALLTMSLLCAPHAGEREFAVFMTSFINALISGLLLSFATKFFSGDLSFRGDGRFRH